MTCGGVVDAATVELAETFELGYLEGRRAWTRIRSRKTGITPVRVWKDTCARNQDNYACGRVLGELVLTICLGSVLF